jgi:hypothetical protein
MIMSESIRKDFPDWETPYKNQRVQTMSWYNENFGFDLEKELNESKIINNDNNDSIKFLNAIDSVEGYDFSNEDCVKFVHVLIENQKIKDFLSKRC